MTSRIFRSILLVAVLVAAASLVLILGGLHSYYAGVQERQLEEELRLASQGVEEGGVGYLEGVASPSWNMSTEDIRMTWIGADGEVLFDTHVPAREMENHADRPEVREALANGQSGRVRYSSTLTEQTLYLARRLDDGTVLRVSTRQLTVAALAMGMLQPILLTLLLAAVLSSVLARRMARGIVAPLNQLDLDRPLENDAYEELSPLLGRIHRQRMQIHEQLRELERKTREFEQITESMGEGLVLLDSRGMVLSMNPAAQTVFHVDASCVGEEFIAVDRSHMLSEAIQSARREGKSEILAARDGHEYQFDITRTDSGDGSQGVVLLVLNLTEKVAAERSRREFTANVSHELKTPLQSILGSAELLESDLVREEDVPRFLGMIRTEAARLVALVEDIIHLSRLDEGIAPEKEDVSLLELAETAAVMLRDRAGERQVSVAVCGDPATVRGVRSFLYEMVYNLLDNAIKYNVEGGKAEVAVWADGGTVAMTVADTGIGIPAGHQSSVFERFFRVDRSRSRASGGTGLGLSIVKHVAQYHNATIRLESGEGKGTRIEVRFPLEEAEDS